jgi:hypothetical protein
VSFEPGARTNWHMHPLGQHLHVIYGIGRVQQKGGPIREIRAGDTVSKSARAIPYGFRRVRSIGTAHRPTCAWSNIAMQEALDGKHVAWMEPVTDEEYSAPLGG